MAVLKVTTQDEMKNLRSVVVPISNILFIETVIKDNGPSVEEVINDSEPGAQFDENELIIHLIDSTDKSFTAEHFSYEIINSKGSEPFRTDTLAELEVELLNYLS